jgi:hypothetical protein
MINQDDFIKFKDIHVKIVELKKQNDNIERAISKRCNEILRLICKHYKQKFEWFAFDNDRSERNYEGGYFDPIAYKTTVGITGVYGNIKKYQDGFPTNFLFLSDEEIKKQL